METLLCLLFGALLGLAHTAGALTCYKGNHTTVTGEFPTGSATCEAKGKTESCVEKRRTKWDSNPGYFELYFGCGKCGKYNKKIIDCHECKTDRCNLDYGKDLKSKVSKLKLCYNTLDTPSGPLPVPVFCPKNQNCSSSTNPNDKNHILTGCQSHCGKLNWKDCRFCDFDLCNLQGDSTGGSASTPPPILKEKIELPEVPSPDEPEVAKASGGAKGARGSDKSQAKAKSSTASSADPAAQPIAMATTFAAVAAACLLGVVVA